MCTQVSAIFRTNAVSEGVVVVGLHLGVPTQFEVPVRIREIEDEKGAARIAGEILGLLTAGAERDCDVVAFAQEPHLGELRSAVCTNRGQGCELGVQQILERIGDAVHDAVLVGHGPPRTKFRHFIFREIGSRFTDEHSRW